MNNDDKEEEINPWTFRRHKTPRVMKESKTIQNHQMRKMNNSPARGLKKSKDQLCQYSSLPKTEVLKHLKFPAIVQTKTNSNDTIQSSKIKNYKHILGDEARSKFLPNYQKIKINASSNQKVKESNKAVPYYIKSLRQYTENTDILKRKQPQQNVTIQKQKRFKTEEPHHAQKQESKRSIIKIDQSQIKLNSIQYKNKPTIKIINLSKNAQKDKVLSKGKLYQDLSQLCDIRGELNSKLSLMKRTYNLKKIQKKLS